VAAPDFGAERIGSASWISSERTTTSRVDSGSTSSCSPPAIARASPLATSIGLGGFCGSFLGLRRLAFNRHHLGNSASLGFGNCQQEDNGISHPWRLRLLLEETCTCAVYSPSTMLPSSNAAFMAGASDSACGAGADSLVAGADSSSATAALGSSPSQVKSVDFLHSTQLVVNLVRLPNQMYVDG
jgi:hypothetical protein